MQRSHQQQIGDKPAIGLLALVKDRHTKKRHESPHDKHTRATDPAQRYGHAERDQHGRRGLTLQRQTSVLGVMQDGKAQNAGKKGQRVKQRCPRFAKVDEYRDPRDDAEHRDPEKAGQDLLLRTGGFIVVGVGADLREKIPCM